MKTSIANSKRLTWTANCPVPPAAAVTRTTFPVSICAAYKFHIKIWSSSETGEKKLSKLRMLLTNSKHKSAKRIHKLKTTKKEDKNFPYIFLRFKSSLQSAIPYVSKKYLLILSKRSKDKNTLHWHLLYWTTEVLKGSETLSKAIEAVSPEVSMATTSGSGLVTGRMWCAGT